MHGSAGGAGGDGGGGRSDLTRLAGRNKLATRALVPSVPLAIGACRFLSRTGDVTIGLTDSFLHRRDPIDLLFCHPFPPYSRTSFDFMVARRIVRGNDLEAVFPGYFSVSTNATCARAINERVYAGRREDRQLARFLGPAIVFPAVEME